MWAYFSLDSPIVFLSPTHKGANKRTVLNSYKRLHSITPVTLYHVRFQDKTVQKAAALVTMVLPRKAENVQWIMVNKKRWRTEIGRHARSKYATTINVSDLNQCD